MSEGAVPAGPDVRLEPATEEHLSALRVGDFERRFGLLVAEGYLEFEGVLEQWLHQLTEQRIPPEWLTHLLVHDRDGALVGMAGFKGPPQRGSVEIGYGVAPAYRDRGYATAAALELVERARVAGVRVVVAHTRPGPNASTGVLRRAGFTRSEVLEDPEEGTVWRWERRLDAERPPGP